MMFASFKPRSILKLDSPLTLAIIATGLFYGAVLSPALSESSIAKYTTEHAVEYVIVTLFFWGMSDILLKIGKMPRESRAINHRWLPDDIAQIPPTKAHELLDEVKRIAPKLLSTRMGRRVTDVLNFVAVRGCGDNFREQVRTLAEQDDQELHDEYTLLRFVIAVTPILGFLGTVVHFGGAIGSFSFDNMDAKLPEIVAGMGTAFNTTSVALATAMTMMFAMFVCERVDRGILHRIDHHIERQIQFRFVAADPSLDPLLDRIQAANDRALRVMVHTYENLAQTWTKNLVDTFALFQLQRREEMRLFAEGIDSIRQNQEQHEVAREDLIRSLVTAIQSDQATNWERFQESLERASHFRDDVRELLQALNMIANGEGRLAETQRTLSDNLRMLRETSQLDSAMNGLTAAIHLMTSRNQISNHSDSRAA